jgi:xanthine dehydrogenase accessory factor
LFEIVRPAAWHVAVFGAGHVGRALLGLLGTLPCRVAWIDPRRDAFPADMPTNASAMVSASPAAMVGALPGGSFVLVMTHDHQLDFDIVAAALRRTDLPFVGLIGSATKRARFIRRLEAQELGRAAITRLTCPIGVPGAGGKLPAEIAIAVAAQLLQARDAASPAAPAPLDRGQPRVEALACGDCGAC